MARLYSHLTPTASSVDREPVHADPLKQLHVSKCDLMRYEKCEIDVIYRIPDLFPMLNTVDETLSEVMRQPEPARCVRESDVMDGVHEFVSFLLCLEARWRVYRPPSFIGFLISVTQPHLEHYNVAVGHSTPQPKKPYLLSKPNSAYIRYDYCLPLEALHLCSGSASPSDG